MTMKVLDFICMTVANAIVWFLSILPRKDAYASSPSAGKKHVLILANNRLGDALVRLPFHKAMREAFPPETHHIAIILDHPITELFGRLPYFDEIIPASPLHFSHALFWIFPKRGYKGVNLIRWAFHHRVDIYIETLRDRSLGSDYIVKLSRPGSCIAYDSSVEMMRTFPASSKFQKKYCEHLYSNLIPSIYGASQFEDYQTLFRYATGRADQLVVVPPQELLSMLADTAPKTLEKPYVVMVPGAMADYRRWQTKCFAEVAHKIGGNIVVVGSPGESTLGDAIPNAVNLCGKTTLAGLGRVLYDASLVITNETGTATYAAVLGVPTVVILGGGDFGSFFPNSHYPNTTSIFHYQKCFCCRWHCTEQKLDGAAPAPCISAITAQDVLSAVDAVTRSRPYASASSAAASSQQTSTTADCPPHP